MHKGVKIWNDIPLAIKSLPKKRINSQYKKFLVKLVVIDYSVGFPMLHTSVIIDCVIITNAPMTSFIQKVAA